MRKLCAFVLILISVSAIAGETVYSIRKDRSWIEDDATTSVQYTLPHAPGAHVESHTAKVKLVYNRESHSDQDWDYPWTYQVKFKFVKHDGTFSSDYTLDISNSTQTEEYVFMDYMTMSVVENDYQGVVGIEIVSSTASYYDNGQWSGAGNPATDTHLPTDIHIELSVKTERYYELDAAKTTRLFFEENNNDITLNWNFIEGAEEYDVEWVYIDSESPYYNDLISDVQAGTADPEEPFLLKEPVGVRVNYNEYLIDKTWPQGAVFYRVRAVGRHIGSEVNGDYSFLKYGEWNYYSTSPFEQEPEELTFLAWLEIDANNDFEDGKSWIYSIGFSDNGKFSSNVVYADGSDRVRQSTAYNSTDDVTLKSENKYDYEGRQVISLSPAPVSGRDLTYEAGFNTVNSGTATFEKEHFDTGEPLQLDNTTGISKYFSPNNNFSQENQGAIPDAGGYAYGQIKFKKDGTGRIDSIGGLGEEFYIASQTDNHATKYYYGSPTYFELKRMFGSNVSDNSNYYRKNMVKDGNGQLSVSYLDGEGRTIATCLAGPTPDNLLSVGGSTTTVTTPINEGNFLTDNGTTLESNFVFVNTVVNNDISLNYDFTGLIYDFIDLSETAVCEDCEYDLEIKIIDPNGVEVVTHTEEISASSYTCNDDTYSTYFNNEAASTINIDYTCTEIGEYKIIKRLSVDVLSMVDDATTTLQDQTLLNSMITDYQADADASGCYTDCDDYCTYIVEYDYDQTNGAGAFDLLSSTVQQSMIDDCKDEACNTDELFDGNSEENGLGGIETVPLFQTYCDSYKWQMEQQVLPGGYLFDLPTTDSYWTSIEDDLPSGTNTLLLYTSYINGVGQGTAIDNITTIANASNWQDEWLPLLLPYHREYCHWELCDDEEASVEFDMELELFIEDPNGPINDTWNETTLDWFWTSSNTDPFVTSTFDPNDELFDILTAYDHPCSTLVDLNLYEYVEAISACIDAEVGQDALTQDEKWSLFIALYKDAKQQVVDAYKSTNTCTHFEDDYAIYHSNTISTHLNSDNATDIQNFNYDNSDFIVPEVIDVCDQNVASWIADLPPTCLAELQAQGEDDDFEDALYAYCYQACNSSNPGGWFYDDGSTEYDDVMLILSNNCSEYSPTYELSSFPTPCETNLIDQNLPICYLLMLDFLNNEFLPNNGESNIVSTSVYSIPNTSDLYDCITPFTAGNDVGWGLASAGADYISEYDVDEGDFICRDFLGLKAREDEVGTGGYTNGQHIEWVDVSQVLNPVKIVESSVNKVIVEVHLNNGNIIECEIIFSLAPCYDAGSFAEDMEVMCDMPSGFITYPNWETDCIDQVQDEAEQNAIDDYNDLLQDAQDEFLQNMNCLNITETFTLTYDLYEYNYTLFYYDQAGNLVQTVPPAGVDLLDYSTDFNATTGLINPSTEPNHTQKTVYTYNGANQIVESQTPDGGITKFYYDELLRLRFTENELQAANNKVSYIIYDELGRTIETGEAGDPGITTLNFQNELNNYSYPTAGLKRDYTKTYYETKFTGGSAGTETEIANTFTNGQENLSNNIGAVEQRMSQYVVSVGAIVPVAGTQFITVSSFSYDFHGNVKEVVQTNDFYFRQEDRCKLLQYDYDLISGSVEEVRYQPGEIDDWRHQYHYDASNRLIRVWTSDDGEEWDMDAKYFYYIHGNLARVERGHDKVQGTDYAYTLAGWVKGANGTRISTDYDIGLDGHSSGLDKYSGADAYGFMLGYYDDDYNGISATNYFAGTSYLTTQNGNYGSLYNGNISHVVLTMKDDNENPINVVGNNYRYDQLQRIKSMDVFEVNAANQANYISTANFSASNAINYGNFATDYSFDGNGNLQSLSRYDNTATLIDNFTYNYDLSKINQLTSVDDAVLSTISSVDVDDQSNGNYAYNSIGQLTGDVQENISLTWTHDNKVRKITQTDAGDTEFIYDASGNRVVKVTGDGAYGGLSYEFYVYDIAGNVMATYDYYIQTNLQGAVADYTEYTVLKDRSIYGAKRLGVQQEDVTLVARHFDLVGGSDFTINQQTVQTEIDPDSYDRESRVLDRKNYELYNHTNNIVEVITDRKVPNTSNDGYEANVVSYSDYYPYGMVMPGRNGSAADKYRYGFQGQEKDDEIKGNGNSINYKYRMHDPRIGRFFAVDPLTAKYPELTPYQFSSNSPIYMVEIEGLEGFPNIFTRFQPKTYSFEEGIWQGAANTLLDHAETQFWGGKNLATGNWNPPWQWSRQKWSDVGNNLLYSVANMTGALTSIESMNYQAQGNPYMAGYVWGQRIPGDVVTIATMGFGFGAGSATRYGSLAGPGTGLGKTLGSTGRIFRTSFNSVMQRIGNFRRSLLSSRSSTGIRGNYEAHFTNWADYANIMKSRGFGIDHIARRVSDARLAARSRYQLKTPFFGRMSIYARNITPSWVPIKFPMGNGKWIKPGGYGNIVGPNWQYFRNKGYSWNQILEGSLRSNKKLKI